MPTFLMPFVERVRGWEPLSGERRAALARRASQDPELLRLLEQFAALTVGDSMDAIAEYVDDNDDPAARSVEGLLALVDEMDLAPVPPPVDRVAESLRKLDRFGGLARASGRAFAARSLAYCGPQAMRAIPALRCAHEFDDDVRVRAYALLALGILAGESENCGQLLRELESTCAAIAAPLERSLAQSVVKHAIDSLSPPYEQISARSFLEACQAGDFPEMLRLAGSVDLNAPGCDGRAVLVEAVLCRREPVVRFLLERGADPNRPLKG